MRILVIEDDEGVRESLRMGLEGESFAIDTASDGHRGSFMARTNEYDLIILDNHLPLKMGREVCADIRNAGKHIPVLMLSVNSNTDTKADLLNGGADDYLTKPYSHKELVARIKALTRRSPVLKASIFSVDDLTLDSMTACVKRGNREIYLTRKEFALLELLLRSQGQIVSRGAILEHVWNIDSDPLSKTVETHIVNLRRKIETGKKKLIRTLHGRGYYITSNAVQ